MKNLFCKISILIFLLLFFGKIDPICNLKSGLGIEKRVICSWYSVKSLKEEGTWEKSHGYMANGKKFDENAMTCATWLYPLGTFLRIESITKCGIIVVEVTDRTSRRFAERIDLTKGAFEKLDRLEKGIIKCKVRRIK